MTYFQHSACNNRPIDQLKVSELKAVCQFKKQKDDSAIPSSKKDLIMRFTETKDRMERKIKQYLLDHGFDKDDVSWGLEQGSHQQENEFTMPLDEIEVAETLQGLNSAMIDGFVGDPASL